MSIPMHADTEPHGQFYFTLHEMTYIANLVGQRPYNEVKQFMDKIEAQYNKAQALMQSATTAPPPVIDPAKPEPYRPYVDRAPAAIEPMPEATHTEEKPANA